MPNEASPSGPSLSGVARQPLDPQSVEGIFIEALSKAAGQPRLDFIDAACQGNAELRTRVEALLRAYDDAGSFLQQPAGDLRNPPLTTAAARPEASGDAHGGIPPGLLRPSEEPGALGTIGPYQVRELIGRGGMGIVLRAFDAKLNRVVAVKALTPELAAQPTARRRFLREAQAAAAVTHPHVVTIHAVDEDNWPYLVMECIDGRSLQDKIERSGTLKLAEVLRIGTQIAEGLAAAHKQGLIHRDIKPANVLLENGVERVKITDFGLAKAADDLTITRPGEISGTPQYMSPEQASGGRVDQRSDLFSLGCVLYAMCAGRPPFRADSMAAIVRKICHDAPQPLGEIDPDVPDWLAAIIDRLLAKDPNERFQTADEVARRLGDALARLQAGQAVQPVAGTPWARRFVASAHPGQKPHVPAWLNFVIQCVAGFWFGRLVAPITRSHEGSLASAAILSYGISCYWVQKRLWSWRLSAAFMVFGLLAFLRVSIVGYESQLFLQRFQLDQAGWLAVIATVWLASYVIWLRLRKPREPSVGARPAARGGNHRTKDDALGNQPSARSSVGHPWKLAGWLVVALLACVLIVPVVALVGVLVPAYQAAQSRDDMRRHVADWGRLKFTFDEDLPIVDIQIDGATCGPIEISPVESSTSPGSHTVTVVYSHGDRKRSVRTKVDLAPQKEQTLDLTPLVERDVQERKKRKKGDAEP